MITNRSGFTLIEVLVAMVLLGFAVLGVQASITDRMVRDVGTEDHRATAQQLAADRLMTIQNDPQYTNLNAIYAGAEDSVRGFPRYQRRTFIAARTGHTMATVQVVTPGGRDTIRRSVAVGAP